MKYLLLILCGHVLQPVDVSVGISHTPWASQLVSSTTTQEEGKESDKPVRIRTLEGQIESDPSNTLLRTQIAALFVESGKASAAIEHLRHAASVEPRNPIFHFMISGVLASQGKTHEAQQEIQMALALDPANPSGRCRNAGFLFMAGNQVGALSEYRSCRDLLTRLGKQDYVDRWGTRYVNARWQDYLPEMIAELEAATSGKSNVVSRVELKGAVQDALDRVNEDPRSGFRRQQLAVIYSMTGNLALAHIEIMEAVRLSPDMATFWATKGTIERELHDYVNALASYRKGLSLTRDNAPSLHFRVAEVLDILGDLRGARGEYENALRKARDAEDEAEPHNQQQLRLLRELSETAIRRIDRILTSKGKHN